MFFATQLKSVTSNGAVDVQGRSLSFIGYLQVKAGDTVYTDGKVIFGNAPPKGAPAIFDEPSGVPVLGDNYFLGEQDDELRGYFTKSGKYKSYQIAGDDWIVNDDRNFKHDADDNIIDVEISDGGELLAVEQIGTSYKVKDNEVTQTCELIILKDGEEIENLSIENLLKEYVDAVKADVEIYVPNHSFSDAFDMQAELLNFKILPDGNWEALIKAEIQASRTVKAIDEKVHYDLQEKTFFYTTDEPWTYSGESVMKIFQEEDTIKIPINITYVDEGKNTASTVRNSLFLLKISSQNEKTTIYELTWNTPLVLTDYKEELIEFSWFDTSDLDNTAITQKSAEFERRYKDTKFPKLSLEDVREASKASFRAYVVLLEDLKGPILPYSMMPYQALVYKTSCVYDSRDLPNSPTYNTPIFEVLDFNFTVQDDYHATIENVDADITKWKLSGISDADNKQVIGAILPDETDAHKWNMSFVKLKNSDCLLGIHKDTDRDIGGALYKIDKDSNVEQVGDGLKNFRLRELIKIRKAKK